ncbi:MAG: hypothetical protein MO847_03085 [Candidatus Protistobacter heckmanni]|nr:hypothetical protein [Candidatus Protistobacter heckmanni]
MKKILSSVLITLSLIGNVKADTSEATFMPQGSEMYSSISPNNVEIYIFKPDFKFKIIGAIDARGSAEYEVPGLIGRLLGSNQQPVPGEKEDIALAIKALKIEAGNAGAQGVVTTQSVQVPIQNGTERRINGVAIRKVD